MGLLAKLDAYALQDGGLDTYEANRALGRGDDERDYAAAAQMLAALGAGRVRLLTDNPDKVRQICALGAEVAEQVPAGVRVSVSNVSYLRAKIEHTGHPPALPA
jgi:GTP cyclohydrolase II